MTEDREGLICFCWEQERIQDFHGGGTDDYVCTRIKSAKPEVPYGQSQGPLKVLGKSVGG